MGDKTKIDWADASWNPITGCQHGCEYCYARNMAKRFGAHLEAIFPTMELDAPFRIIKYKELSKAEPRGKTNPYPYDFTPTFHRYKLDQPKRWERPRTIFVCSMADLFGAWVPDEWIEEVFAACKEAEQHRYLFLTKNPYRYIELAMAGKLPAEENFWYGTSTTTPESPAFFSRGHNTFLSIEPILEKFDKPGDDGTVANTNWVIIGAETGNRKGKVIPEKEWIDEIARECEKRRKPLFMKSSLQQLMGEDFVQEFPWGGA